MTQDVTQMPSVDLEIRLMAITSLSPYMPNKPIPEITLRWMTEAVKELQLRRLARSAG